MTKMTEDIVSLMKSTLDFPTHSIDLWRPFSQVKPKDYDRVIVRTDKNMYYECVYVKGTLIRHINEHEIEVTDPQAWIHYPYSEAYDYMSAGWNGEMPLALAMTYLLREKHEVEYRLAKKAFNHVLDTNGVAKKLRSELQSALSQINTLQGEKEQLQTDVEEAKSIFYALQQQIGNGATIEQIVKFVKGDESSNAQMKAMENAINELTQELKKAQQSVEGHKRAHADMVAMNRTLRNENKKYKDMLCQEKLRQNYSISGAPTIERYKYNELSECYTALQNLVKESLQSISQASAHGLNINDIIDAERLMMDEINTRRNNIKVDIPDNTNSASPEVATPVSNEDSLMQRMSKFLK